VKHLIQPCQALFQLLILILKPFHDINALLDTPRRESQGFLAPSLWELDYIIYLKLTVLDIFKLITSGGFIRMAKSVLIYIDS
jgi:hypothetical protein